MKESKDVSGAGFGRAIGAAFSRFFRAARFPLLLSGLLAVLGVPVFLRLPLWCDVTLYDVAAREILSGGVHYRDVFDTNPPGFVWCLTLLRATLGTSSIAVRAVDLAIFAGIVFALDRLAKMGGGSGSSRGWAAAAALAIYLFGTEYIHAQRDIWLALPILAALVLRLRRIGSTSGGGGYFWPAFAEGLLWGLSTWIKPQVIPLALAAWLLTARRLSGGSRRIAARDLAGNLAAGTALGLLGLGYLVASGTWPHYWIVITEWNVHYSEIMFSELGGRLDLELTWFRPWSAWLVPTAALVTASLIDGRIFSAKWRPDGEPGPVGRALTTRWFDPAPDDRTRFTRAVLAGMLGAWVAVSLFSQREFIYVHVLEILLMIAVWSAHRWCLPAVVLAGIAALNLGFVIADERADFEGSARSGLCRMGWDYDKLEIDYRHPLTRRTYYRSWRAAFSTPPSGQDDARLKDAVKREKPHPASTNYIASTNWEELGEVEAYLRSQRVKDWELVCWNEGVHSLYSSLGLRPGLRFMHIHNTDGIGPDAYRTVRTELMANAAIRFVVVDLEWVARQENWDRKLPYHPGRSADDLQPILSPTWDGVFPYDGRKTVFRSDGGRGRYLVYAIRQPLGKVD